MLPFFLTFCHCVSKSANRVAEFRQRNSIHEDGEVLDKIFISTLPWISYTALVQPVPTPADSNPRITWGKYFSQGDRVLLPVSALCHHALIDGVYIANFYKLLDKEIESIIK